MKHRPSDRASAAGVVLAVAGGGAWLYAHAVASRASARKGLESERTALLAQADEAELAACNARMHQMIRALDRRMPTSNALPVLLRDLVKALEALGVREQRVRTLKERRDTSTTAIPIELTFRGAFPVVYGLLERLEQTEGATVLRRLSIECDGEAGPKDLRVAMELDAIMRTGEETP